MNNLQKISKQLRKIAQGSKLPKRIPNEKKYVEYDAETEFWSIFGEKSGFCYGQYGSEEEAKKNLGVKQAAVKYQVSVKEKGASKPLRVWKDFDNKKKAQEHIELQKDLCNMKGWNVNELSFEITEMP